MDLDARHRRIDRRGLEVEQPDRRGAHEDELALEAERIGRARRAGPSPKRSASCRAGEMDPELAPAVGRDLERRAAHALDAGLVGLDQDRRPSR